MRFARQPLLPFPTKAAVLARHAAGGTAAHPGPASRVVSAVAAGGGARARCVIRSGGVPIGSVRVRAPQARPERPVRGALAPSPRAIEGGSCSAPAEDGGRRFAASRIRRAAELTGSCMLLALFVVLFLFG
jgi:hypothetical protein